MSTRSVLALAAMLTAAASAQPASPELRAGAAAVKITPPLGVSLAGYYHPRGAEAVLDDLYARALVLDDGATKAALVTLDLISTQRGFVAAARARIEKATGIPAAHVMISATHTHTGPSLMETAPANDPPGSPARLAADYTARLPDLVAQVVQQAHDRLAPARVLAAVGREDTLAHNRRFHMRDGSVGWNPGVKNPAIVKPAGPIDPDVPFVYLETPKGEPIATHVSYAVHMDNTGGVRLSADLATALTRGLAAWKGDGHVTLYASGACGDVNQVNVAWDHRQQSPEQAARMGTVLAGEVLRRWPQLRPVTGPLAVRSEVVPLPLDPATPEDVAAARKVMENNPSDRTRDSFMALVKARKVLDVAARLGKPLEAEVQVVTLGSELAWVALPGEIFVQLGLDVKQDSPFPQTMIAELANGSIGYVPNRRAWPQGNYEVVSARCAEGSGEQLVRTAVRLLKDCHRDLPQPTAARP